MPLRPKCKVDGRRYLSCMKKQQYQALVEGFCRSAGIPLPFMEYKFHPTRKWRFDFAWPSPIGKPGVALEIDGGVFVQGGHTRGKGYENDRIKDGEATVLGWRVLRVSTGQLAKGVCWPWLESLFKKGVKHGG